MESNPNKKTRAKSPDKYIIKDEQIEEIIQWIIDGLSYRQMAEKLGCSLGLLHNYLSKNEHHARANEAREVSANTYADKAEEVLLNAERDKDELMRARELSQYYRWKAAKRLPKVYSDKIDHTSNGDKINTLPVINVSIMSGGVALASSEEEIED